MLNSLSILFLSCDYSLTVKPWQIDCLIKEYDDAEAMVTGLIENLHRLDLNPIEEAKAYQRMMQEFGYSQEKIATILGKSRAGISNTLRLLKLDL